VKKLLISAALIFALTVVRAGAADLPQIFVLQCYKAADCAQLQCTTTATAFGLMIRAHHDRDIAVLSATLNPANIDPTVTISTMLPTPFLTSDDPEHRLKSVAESGVRFSVKAIGDQFVYKCEVSKVVPNALVPGGLPATSTTGAQGSDVVLAGQVMFHHPLNADYVCAIMRPEVTRPS
jgi:hypothetical protein